MNSYLTQDFLTIETISMTVEGDNFSLQSEEFELTHSSVSLSTQAEDSFRLANRTCALTSAAASSATPPPTTASGNLYTWAKGISASGGKIKSGYYDVNKSSSRKTDKNLCWAAAASNMIAWWQKTYKTTSRIGTSVPTSASGIFASFKKYWKNEGGQSYAGCRWWLGGSNAGGYWYEGYAKYPNKQTGGYYKSFYTTSTSTWNVVVSGSFYNTKEVGTTLANLFKQGNAIQLNLNKPGKDSGHAITLWGVTRSSSGALTAIHVTDSDDRKTGVTTYKVSYNSTYKQYKLTSGGSLKNWYISGYCAMGAFTFTNYSIPGSAKVKKSGKYVTFKWSNKSKGSSITHQVAYKKKGASSFTYVSTTSRSLKVELPTDGTYEWRVRTKVGTAFTSDWLKPGKFTFTGAPPKITFYSTTKSKVSSSKTKIGLRWKSNENATFELRLDGKLVFKGSGKSVKRRYFTVKNGTHTYKLTAKDKYGNKSYYSGKLVCGDTTAPTLSNLKATTKDASTSGKSYVSFSWNSSESATYVLTLNGTQIYKGTNTYFNYSTALSNGTYSYKLTATDASGNTSYQTSSFTCNAVTLSAPYDLIIKDASREGNDTHATLSWDSNNTASGVTYRLDYSFTGSNYQTLDYYSTTYANVSISGSGTLYWRVYAVDSSDNLSSYTQGKTFNYAATDTTAPEAPYSLKVNQTSQYEVTLSWSAASDSSPLYYEVQMKKGYSGTYSTYTTASTSISFNLSGTATRYWQVRAVDAWGNATSWVTGSSFSNYTSITSALVEDTQEQAALCTTPTASGTSESTAAETSSLATSDTSLTSSTLLMQEVDATSSTTATAATTSLDEQLALSAGDLCLLGCADYSSCGGEACAALLEDAAALEEKRNAALAATA